MQNFHNNVIKMNKHKGLEYRHKILKLGANFGFDIIRFAKPEIPINNQEQMKRFCENGEYGDMKWMHTHLDRRLDPKALMADVKTIIMIGVNYAPISDPLLRLRDKGPWQYIAICLW